MRRNTWSDLLLIFQCSFHHHVFIESVWNAVSSGQQCIYSPWSFLATFNVFSVIPPHFEKWAFLRKQLCWWVGKLWPSEATGDEILTLAEGRGASPATAAGSACHGECFGLLCPAANSWRWDLCSCVASYKEVLNLLAPRHCRKANAKLSCEQWKWWNIRAIGSPVSGKGRVSGCSQQIFLLLVLSAAGRWCATPGQVASPLMEGIHTCVCSLFRAGQLKANLRMLFLLASSSPSFLMSSDNINWKTFQEEWVWFYFGFLYPN